jgi:gamma-glutamylcysteine synthetase
MRVHACVLQLRPHAVYAASEGFKHSQRGTASCSPRDALQAQVGVRAVGIRGSCMQVPRTGLQTPFRGGTVRDVAQQVLEIARGGLERRGNDETGFLRKLQAIVDSGESQAEALLRLYDSEWNHSVDPVYKYMAF